jgi:hypothetical protein
LPLFGFFTFSENSIILYVNKYLSSHWTLPFGLRFYPMITYQSHMDFCMSKWRLKGDVK